MNNSFVITKGNITPSKLEKAIKEVLNKRVNNDFSIHVYGGGTYYEVIIYEYKF